MRILVTGGCGFIGSNFINYIISSTKVDVVVNLDCLNYCAKEENVVENEKYHFVYGDIKDEKIVSRILNKYDIDTIIHFAAQSHVDSSFGDDFLKYVMDNVYGTGVLINECKKYSKIVKFIHFSTDEVYGDVDETHQGCNEESILNPTNPYAASKAGAEMLVKSFYNSFKFPVITIRCNNVYGPRQYKEKLIPKFIDMIKNGDFVTIHGLGDQLRNFIWVDDVSSAIELILEKGLLGEIYNIEGNKDYSVIQITEMLVKLIKNDSVYSKYIKYVEDRPYNDKRYKLNSEKLRKLGWERKYDNIEENLKLLI